jgi:hypothetical protein
LVGLEELIPFRKLSSATCDALEERRSSLFLWVMDIIKELKGPPLIRDSMLLTRDQMQDELGILRVAWGT